MNLEQYDQNTKSVIKKTFLELYSKAPLSKIKVTDLINLCAISRGTFYFYFSDVYSLYRECEADMLQRMEMGLDGVKLAAVQAKPSKYIKEYIKHLDNLAAQKNLLKIFLTGSERDSFRKGFTNRIFIQYSNAMDFTDDLPEDIRNLVIRFYASGVCELLCSWILDDCQSPAKALAEANLEIMYRGTFPRANLKD